MNAQQASGQQVSKRLSLNMLFSMSSNLMANLKAYLRLGLKFPLHLQEYDVGMFATEEPSYMPCEISRKPYTRPVADFDASNISQYQRPSHHQSFWKRIVSAF